MSAFERLRQGLEADLYCRNAFRVAELGVNASPRAVDSHWRRLQMRRKLGAGSLETGGLLVLRPASELDAVREAVDRLRDPDARFFEEFFWFWPALPGSDGEDSGLESLARGDALGAWACWGQAAGAGAAGAVGRHNLAVLTHALALDLESVSCVPPSGDTLLAQRDRLWAESLSAWAALVQQEEFWDLVLARIQERNEPQLKRDVAFQIRDHLPAALLTINARLAVRAAEQGCAADVTRHREIMRRAPFDADVADTAVRLALKPQRARIQRLCQSEPDNNQADNWRAAWELSQRLLPIPLGDTQREAIRQDVAEVESRLCWFCQSRRGDSASAIRLWMHHHVERKRTDRGAEVRWQQLTIDVPRCDRCYSAHRSWEIRLRPKQPAALEMRPESDKIHFPVIQQRLAEGWQMGARPPGV